jgi:hypothetical protein
MREGFVEDQPIDDVDDTTKIPAVTDAPSPPPEEWPITVRLLHKQVRNNAGEMVSELHFREPTANDIARAGGNPCRLDGNLDPIIDDAKMLRIMAHLSGVMEPFLQRMDPRDYNSCAYRLRNFFLPEAAAWVV